MTLPRIKENLEFKNKMPVNFLTDWHYAAGGDFYACICILRAAERAKHPEGRCRKGM